MHISKFPSLFSVLALVLVSTTSLASSASKCQAFIHAVPHLPSQFNPAKVSDVFSYHLAIQLHGGLFSLDLTGKPKKYLVEDYKVTEEGKRWQFSIQDKWLNLGITSQKIKQQLENRVKKRVLGYKKMNRIKGFKEFIGGKQKQLIGIRVANKQNLIIELNQPDVKIIEILADIRFAILPDAKNPKIGLGPYKLLVDKPDRIEIERKSLSKECDTLTKIRFTTYSLEQLSESLPTHIFAGLMYPFSHRDQAKFAKHRSIALSQSIAAPRLYFWGINPRVKNLNQRKSLAQQLDRVLAVRTCYEGNAIVNSVIPKGYLGYLNKNDYLVHKPQKELAKKWQDLNISIASGIGSETCMKNLLKKWFPGAKVTIRPSVQHAELWNAGKIQMIFSYLEGAGLDSSHEIFQAFMESNLLQLGDLKHHPIEKSYREFRNSKTYGERFQNAKNLNRKILNLFSVVPLFTPKTYYFFHKSIQPIANLVISPIQLRYDLLQLKRP